ncbi:unnamed protein product [Polarella glacialis]|uniref:holo-[acyl-carrier-protein] synthase n=1 Tax=Polarella glacialis TaxID=89957 RepID=A0A813LV48_POLGL|nr:unnamed protein product [Polarella glacialis]
MGQALVPGSRTASPEVLEALCSYSLQSPASSWGPASDLRCNWAVDAEAWQPPGGSLGEEFNLLLSQLPQSEQVSVLAVPALQDRKRSLLGRLLVLRACALALGAVDFSQVQLGRTKGKKPFLRHPLPPGLPNFNFNVSHDGRWVVLASDALHLVGVDVSAPQSARGDREDDTFLDDLYTVIHESEAAMIRAQGTVSGRYAVFQRIWSAKESVTKAIGQGVDFGLERIEVTLIDEASPDSRGSSRTSLWAKLFWPSSPREAKRSSPAESSEELPQQQRRKRLRASVCIDMWPRRDWDIWQEELPGGHWVSVALGPIEEAVDADGVFTATLRLPGLGGPAGLEKAKAAKARDLVAKDSHSKEGGQSLTQLQRLPEETPTAGFQVLTLDALLPAEVAKTFRELRTSQFG